MRDDARPVLAQLNIVVADMAASVAFYRRLGLTVDDTGPWAAHHVEVEMPGGVHLDLDSAEFARRWNAGARSQAGPSRNVIGFNLASRQAVDDLYALLMGAGYVGQQAPYDTFWGARYAVIEDPDENPVGLMSPLDPSRRGAPPVI